jgi:hypothetical protein
LSARIGIVQPLTLFWSLLYILACTAKSVLVLLSRIPHWKGRTIQLEPGRPNPGGARIPSRLCTEMPRYSKYSGKYRTYIRKLAFLSFLDSSSNTASSQPPDSNRKLEPAISARDLRLTIGKAMRGFGTAAVAGLPRPSPFRHSGIYHNSNVYPLGSLGITQQESFA